MSSENTENKTAVSASGLSKHFGDIHAVNSLDFEVSHGRAVGFLGPNGAGKTTLMRMICCMARPTSGALRVLGLNPLTHPADIKKDIGVVPQLSSLDDDLTVIQNMLLYARYHNISQHEAKKRSDELLKFVSLEERPEAFIDELSGGMQRRLLIARALINKPKVIILDEPTTGLDPQVRHLIWQRLRELKRQGITLLITTHYMEEAENLCDEVFIMNSGRIVEQGAPQEMVRNLIGRFTLEVDSVNGADGSEVRAIFKGANCRIERFGDRLYVNADDSEILTARINSITHLNPILRPSTLEDVFLKLTGRELKGNA